MLCVIYQQNPSEAKQLLQTTRAGANTCTWSPWLADHMINPDPSWLKGTQLFLMYKTTKKPVVDNTQDESRKHEVTANPPPHPHKNKTAYNGAFSQ